MIEARRGNPAPSGWEIPTGWRRDRESEEIDSDPFLSGFFQQRVSLESGDAAGSKTFRSLKELRVMCHRSAPGLLFLRYPWRLERVSRQVFNTYCFCLTYA